MADAPTLLSLTERGAALGARLADALGGVHLALSPGEAGDEIRTQFAAGRPLIGICAAGILIRTLAPLLGDKRAEPPVIAVAEDGSSAVPLLGGHRGANALAVRVGEILKGHAAITTAGDLAFGVALDAPPTGWHLENPEDAKDAMRAALAGEPLRLSGDAPWLDALPAERTQGDPVVLSAGDAPPLVYRRRTLALGVGCIRHAEPDALIALAARSLADAGFAEGQVAAVVSLDLKADEAAVHALAAHLGVPARFFDAATLAAEAPRLASPSEVVEAEVGCPGVAEGAALAMAGPDGVLEVPKQKGDGVTCAIARLGTAPKEGRVRGKLSVVGIGPGDASWRTPEATRLILEADEVVGYGLYLDLLGPLAAGKSRAFPLGEERERCAYALERAGEGQAVALVSSGDAGIYAMGALVAELLDTGDLSAAARRVEVVNAPGISAMQAASARAGALLGHDFCAISLSDLLTPRDAILARLRAAAAGDFVVALYNPVSKRRRTLLDAAREILLDHRPADTPVLLASDLGRPAERLRHRTLETLRTEEVDMLTTVIIGARASRAFATGDQSAGAGGARLYTPRGYAAKA